MSERPLGVTILGILWIISAFIWFVAAILGGAVLVGVGLGAIGAIFGFILFCIAIVDLLLGVGCFKGWGWVWIVGVLFMVINILFGLMSLLSSWIYGVISIIIAGIILWYLFQPQVKAYFGKT
jgi:hypothetical protein